MTQLPSRDVPSNDHVWADLESLIAQVHAFKKRTHDRRAAFIHGADELRQVEERCDQLLGELARIAGKTHAS